MVFSHSITPQDVLRKLGLRSTDPDPGKAAVREHNVVGVQITKQEGKPLTVHVRVANQDVAELYTLVLESNGWQNVVGRF